MDSNILGVIASSGGGVIFEILPFLRRKKIDLKIITDRSCEIESKCIMENIEFNRIVYKDKNLFSKEANLFFKSKGVMRLVLLFFTRLIAEEIYGNFFTFNIHPSFLPLFAGFGALKKVSNSDVKLLGASVHRVNENLDKGPIFAQIMNSFTKDKIEFISFMQKVYLALAVIDAYIYYPEKLKKPLDLTTYYINASFKLSYEAESFFREIEMRYATKILARS
ncbi:MAG: formyltransferase family protein [Pseudomonadota bacterium]